MMTNVSILDELPSALVDPGADWPVVKTGLGTGVVVVPAALIWAALVRLIVGRWA
jgi:hypothetical protein